MSRERRLKRNKVLYSDAVPSTDLPPLVQGELRCFLSLVVGKITWGTSYKTPICPAFIKLRWWGEVSDGTILRPEMESDGSVIKSRAKFAIRSGPKQMSAYFNDMETINLEILASPNAVPLAFVHIPRLQDLTSNNPIEGKFPIISLSSRKLGEIEVALHFKSIHDAFDNKLETVVSQPPVKLSSSTRTHNSSCNSIRSRSSSREGSIKRGRKSRSRQKATATGGRKKSVSLERNRSVSNDSKKSSQISTKSNQSSRTKRKKKIITPRGVDDILQAEGHDLYRVSSPHISDTNEDDAAAKNPTTKQLKETPRQDPSNHEQEKEIPRSSVAPPAPPQDLPTRPSGYPPPRYYEERSRLVEQSLLNLNYMREINKKKLQEEKLLKTPNITSDMRMIELLFGSNMSNHYNNDATDDTTSFYSTPHSIFSDGEDPLQDSKLLDQLFYNRMGFYREEVKKLNDNLCVDNQLSSLVDDALLHKKKEEVKELDKLDISTRSLQAVRSVRVSLHSLTIAMKNPRKQTGKHSKSKPPSAKRRSFYVDYKLPGFDFIRCTSKHQSVNLRDDGEVVKFDEETNFPISFDPELVRIWLQTSLAFVLFEKDPPATSSKKKEIGMVKLQLCDVINAPNHVYQSDLVMTSRDETYSLGISIDLVMGAAKQQEKDVSYPSCSHQHTGVIPDNKQFTISNKPKQVKPKYYDHEENVETKHLSCQILCFYLSIKNARDIPGIQIGAKLIDPNTFLVTKFFASEQVGKTATIWSTSNPVFNFNQFVPVQIDANLFKRMGNNYVVIEIWTRISKTENDKLIGIVKVSLNIFHQSLVKEDIARSVLSTQYPMISCDGYQDIVDLFTGTLRGKLNVLLALGTKEQIEQLRKIKEFDTATDGGVTSSNDQQQQHDDDDVIVANLYDDVSNMEKLHCIQVKIRGLKNFKPQDDQIYGETDCFIRYRFPTLDADSGNKLATLCEYSTESTLCTPEPQFNYQSSHHYNSTIPLHVLLRNACSGVGKYPGGGIPFELWSRFYYPNVRDQLIAKGILPVAKLIPLISGLTNEKSKKENLQIAMKLVESTTSSVVNHDVIGGQLQVSVEYLHGDDVTELLERHQIDDVVTMEMEITRCCGLKAGLQQLIDDDVIDGCECYVTIKPPHALMSSNKNIEIERKLTTNCVKSKEFAPQFHHRLSLSAPLLRHRGSGSDDVISLGEVIGKEIVEVEIWQKRRRRNSDDTSSRNDVIIGNVKIDLSWLLVRTNGIRGWFPIKSLRHSSDDDVTHHVGGIELSLQLANRGDDQTKLLNSTKFPREFPSHHSHLLMTSSSNNRLQPLAMTSSLRNQHSHVTICVNVTSLQLRCDEEDVGTRMYVRYKLHGHDTMTSRLTKPLAGDDVTMTSVSIAHRKLYLSEIDETLIYNLREKPLQLQLWCRRGKDADDVLVGTTYVDMSPLLDGRLQRHQRAGGEILPMYGANLSDIRRASLRCYITSTPGDHTDLQDVDDDVVNVTPSSRHDVGNDQVFTASILIERGMHMPDDVTSTVRVTYDDASGQVHTTSSQIASSNPRWDEVQEVQLPTQLLSQGGVVMRVTYGDDDVIVGTVTVDVSLLMTPGFSMINGWYNVIDTHGGCHGQLKIAVSPTSDLSDVIVAKPPAPVRSSSEAAKRHHGKLAAPLVETPSGSVCYVPGVDRGDNGTVGSGDLSEVLRRKMRELDEIRRSFDRKIRALNNGDNDVIINTMTSPPPHNDDEVKFLCSTPSTGHNSTAAAKRSAMRSPEVDDDVMHDDDDEVEVIEPRNLNLMTSQSMCSSIHDDTSLFHSTAPHHDHDDDVTINEANNDDDVTINDANNDDDVTINEGNNDDVIVELGTADDETSTIANDDDMGVVVGTKTPPSPQPPHDDESVQNDDVIEDIDVITEEDDTAVGDCDVIKEDEVECSDDDEEEKEETSIFSDDSDDEVTTTNQQLQVEAPTLGIAEERENLKSKFEKKSTRVECCNVDSVKRIPSFFPPTQNLMEKMKCLREFTNQQQLKLDLACEHDSHNSSTLTSSTSPLTSSTRSDRRRLVASRASADREGTKRLERIFKSKSSSSKN